MTTEDRQSIEAEIRILLKMVAGYRDRVREIEEKIAALRTLLNPD